MRAFFIFLFCLIFSFPVQAGFQEAANYSAKAEGIAMVVMKNGNVVEAGLADQVLDDPQHPYTQLLVSSILQV